MATRSYHHGDLRAALVGAAIEALERGEAEISLRGVAKAAGVSAMAPYRHFPDKQALLAAVAGEGFARLRDRLRGADDHPDPARALVAQGLAYVDFARAHPALVRLMFQCAADDPVPGGDSAYAVLVERVAALVPDEARDGAALLCWATVHGLATLANDMGADLGPADSDAVLQLLVDSLPRR